MLYANGAKVVDEHTHESASEGGLIHRLSRLFLANAYISPIPGVRIAGGWQVVDVLRAVPFLVVRPLTIDRIALEVTGGAPGGSVARLGIYSDNGSVYPGALLLDASTVAIDSGGVKAATIDQALTPGLYWLAVVCNGQYASDAFAPSQSPVGLDGSAFTTVYGGYSKAFAYAALPDPFGAGGAVLALAPLLTVRVKSLD